MIQKIRVVSTNPNEDLLSKSLLSEIKENLTIKSIKQVGTSKVYRLEEATKKQGRILYLISGTNNLGVISPFLIC